MQGISYGGTPLTYEAWQINQAGYLLRFVGTGSYESCLHTAGLYPSKSIEVIPLSQVDSRIVESKEAGVLK